MKFVFSCENTRVSLMERLIVIVLFIYLIEGIESKSDYLVRLRLGNNKKTFYETYETRSKSESKGLSNTSMLSYYDEKKAKHLAKISKLTSCAKKPLRMTCKECFGSPFQFKLFLFSRKMWKNRYGFNMMIMYNDSAKEIWISFSGPKVLESYSLIKEIYSAGFAQLESIGGVEIGFKNIYFTKIRQEIVQKLKFIMSKGRKSYKIVFTGHSLGGSLATLTALDLSSTNTKIIDSVKNKIEVYTFGALRIGDTNFEERVKRSLHLYKIIRDDDFVVRIPNCFYYARKWECFNSLVIEKLFSLFPKRNISDVERSKLITKFSEEVIRGKYNLKINRPRGLFQSPLMEEFNFKVSMFNSIVKSKATTEEKKAKIQSMLLNIENISLQRAINRRLLNYFTRYAEKSLLEGKLLSEFAKRIVINSIEEFNKRIAEMKRIRAKHQSYIKSGKIVHGYNSKYVSDLREKEIQRKRKKIELKKKKEMDSINKRAAMVNKLYKQRKERLKRLEEMLRRNRLQRFLRTKKRKHKSNLTSNKDMITTYDKNGKKVLKIAKQSEKGKLQLKILVIHDRISILTKIMKLLLMKRSESNSGLYFKIKETISLLKKQLSVIKKILKSLNRLNFVKRILIENTTSETTSYTSSTSSKKNLKSNETSTTTVTYSRVSSSSPTTSNDLINTDAKKTASIVQASLDKKMKGNIAMAVSMKLSQKPIDKVRLAFLNNIFTYISKFYNKGIIFSQPLGQIIHYNKFMSKFRKCPVFADTKIPSCEKSSTFEDSKKLDLLSHYQYFGFSFC